MAHSRRYNSVNQLDISVIRNNSHLMNDGEHEVRSSVMVELQERPRFKSNVSKNKLQLGQQDSFMLPEINGRSIASINRDHSIASPFKKLEVKLDSVMLKKNKRYRIH